MVFEIADQAWLQDESLQTLLSLLQEGGEEARINGGAVRNALMGLPVNDVDVSTTLVPRDVLLRLKNGGYKVVPTGIGHGTVTAVLDGTSYEVTTLRRDIETDGRHATVLYGRDWTEDARRRDLTINALYADASGKIHDPLGGLPDVMSQTIRFIDNAETRIREDYLRILRFFRFFAWYGKHRPDAEGLKACAKLKDGLRDLSAERIWQEISKLMAAPDPSRALLWMRQTGVLSTVLPETEKWGIDSLPRLIAAELEHGWEPDALLRLMSIIPPREEVLLPLSSRLKLSNVTRERLLNWADTPVPDGKLKKLDFQKWLYWQNEQGAADRLRMAIVADPSDRKTVRQLRWLTSWERPVFPVRGQDLLDSGMQPGPAIAARLRDLETRWVEGGFELGADDMPSSG